MHGQVEYRADVDPARGSVRDIIIGALAIEERAMNTKRIGYGSAVALWCVLMAAGVGGAEPSLPGGALHIVDQHGTPTAACPLKHTDVEADISGFVSRVRVRQ